MTAGTMPRFNRLSFAAFLFADLEGFGADATSHRKRHSVRSRFSEFGCGVIPTRYHSRTGQFPQMSGPTLARPSNDPIPLGGFVRRPGSDRVSSKKSAPPKPKDILWKSAEDPLWVRYQEIIRLRRAVQEAAAAAAQSSKKGEIDDGSR